MDYFLFSSSDCAIFRRACAKSSFFIGKTKGSYLLIRKEIGNFFAEKSSKELSKLLFNLRFENDKLFLYEQNSNIQKELNN